MSASSPATSFAARSRMSTLTPLAVLTHGVSGFRFGHDEAMSPSKPAVVIGVRSTAGRRRPA